MCVECKYMCLLLFKIFFSLTVLLQAEMAFEKKNVCQIHNFFVKQKGPKSHFNLVKIVIITNWLQLKIIWHAFFFKKNLPFSLGFSFEKINHLVKPK